MKYYENISPGNPSGPENMLPGVPYPTRKREGTELAPTKSVTSLTRSGKTVTASCTSHGLVPGNRVQISGANQSAYNNEFYVKTTANANTFTFDVGGAPTTPATGTILCRKVRQEVNV